MLQLSLSQGSSVMIECPDRTPTADEINAYIRRAAYERSVALSSIVRWFRAQISVFASTPTALKHS